ncbi:PAS domain S-box protein [Caldimonas tepidiphila]|uniref:PAS domain S-box protein n=1 Tax=Caldimonas tepidiphila TaxID=2315841 RepID=UPI000E5A80CE|nr:PAS domain S-box protein [Caldimonas tepidiphila]
MPLSPAGAGTGRTAGAPRQRSLRRSLSGLVLAALLPLALGAMIVQWQHWQARRASVQQGLRDTAQALMLAIEGELATERALLELLAASPLIDAGDWEGFRSYAAEVTAKRPGTMISVLDPDGQVRLNTVAPLGAPLPNLLQMGREDRQAEWSGQHLPLGSPETFRRVFEAAAPVYGNLHLNPQLKQPLVGLAVPVLREGRPRHALLLALTPERLSRLLRELDVDAEVRLTLSDRAGRVVATGSGGGGAPRLGEQLPPELTARLALAPLGLFEQPGKDGEPLIGAYAASTTSGWAVHVTLPRREAFASVQRAGYAWIAIVGSALALGLFLAALLARRLTGPLGELAAAADAMHHGGLPALAPMPVREIDTLRRALQRAAQWHQEHQQEQMRRIVAEQREAVTAQIAEALRDSREHLRRVIDRLQASVAVLDLEGRLLEVNDSPVKAAGLDRERLLGRPFWDCDWWRHDASVRQRLREAVATAREGTPVRHDLTACMAQDQVITIDCQLAPLRDAGGRITHLVASGIDISQRLATEAALRDSEARARRAAAEAEAERGLLDAVLQAAPAGIIVADADGRLVRMNRANERLWGSAPFSNSIEEYREWKGWWADGSPRHGRRLEPQEWALARALAGETPPGDLVEIEPFGAPPGTRRTMLNSGAPVRDAQGRIVGAVIVQMDLTERMAAEAAQRESETRFRALADNMSQLAWITDERGHALWYNRRWFEYTGTRPEQTAGWGWQTVHHSDHLERVSEGFRRCLACGEPWEDTFPLRRADGEFRWFLSRAQPLRDAAGRITRWFGTNTDVTEQRAAEQALRDSEERLLRSERALREADRQKDEFLATLAHELRNPLAPIRSAAHVIRLRQPPDPAVARAGELIERQSVHMTRLVDDLLEVSRITLGRIVLKLRAESLASVVANAVDVARPTADARRQRLVVELPDEPLVLQADATRLSQALQNVLNNAVKFTPEGGRITLAARREGGGACLTIRDEGSGIAPEMLERIFGMFVQERRETAQAGLGIGLALARRLIGLHGGHIEASSEGPGTGSTFTIRLPLDSAGAEPPARAAGDAAKACGRAAPARVLVVDDNVDAAEMLQTVLELQHHEVRLAHDGGSALAAEADWRPAVVVLDIGLPDIDGYEVARRLRARHAGQRGPLIVALTGWGQDSDRQRAREAGFDHHFTKPVDPDALQELLRRELATREPGVLPALQPG